MPSAGTERQIIAHVERNRDTDDVSSGWQQHGTDVSTSEDVYLLL